MIIKGYNFMTIGNGLLTQTHSLVDERSTQVISLAEQPVRHAFPYRGANGVNT